MATEHPGLREQRQNKVLCSEGIRDKRQTLGQAKLRLGLAASRVPRVILPCSELGSPLKMNREGNKGFY